MLCAPGEYKGQSLSVYTSSRPEVIPHAGHRLPQGRGSVHAHPVGWFASGRSLVRKLPQVRGSQVVAREVRATYYFITRLPGHQEACGAASQAGQVGAQTTLRNKQSRRGRGALPVQTVRHKTCKPVSLEAASASITTWRSPFSITRVHLL